MKQPRCKKCGRVLKSPASIARGIGPECAGIKSTGRKRFNLGQRRGSATSYQAAASHKAEQVVVSTPVERPAAKPKKETKQERVKRKRQERRDAFEARQSFQIGVAKGAPLIYTPQGADEWTNSSSNRVTTHEALRAYLKRYQFI